MESKNILVTGVSRGVGLEITKQLLDKGYNVYGVSRSYPQALEELEEKYKGQFFHKEMDLSLSGEVRNLLFRDFVSNKIPLYGFINNAAMAYDDIISNLNEERLEQMFRVNTFTPMMITKYAIRNMLFNKIRGSIVHISSISVHTGYKGLAMYAGSKGALEAFSKNTAREWGELGIRSNTIVAGFMDTDMSSTLTDDMKNRIYKRTSLKRPTEISSVASMVCFLMSEESKSVTGQNIHVDAGTI